jgi:hypothetical protein
MIISFDEGYGDNRIAHTIKGAEQSMLRALLKTESRRHRPSLKPTRLADGLELEVFYSKSATALRLQDSPRVPQKSAERWFPRVARLRAFHSAASNLGRQIVNTEILRLSCLTINVQTHV